MKIFANVLAIGVFLFSLGFPYLASTNTNSPPPLPTTTIEELTTNTLVRLAEMNGLTNGAAVYYIELVSAPSLKTPVEDREPEGVMITMHTTDTNRFYWLKITREFEK